MEERLAVLVAELDAQWNTTIALHTSATEKMSRLKGDLENEDLKNSLAYKLHNLYSSYEDIFKIIIKFFENHIDDLSTFHTGLLKRMALNINGIRPALLSDHSLKILDELRGFRHVFRHAYGYELDTDRVIKMAEKIPSLKESFATDLNTFKQNL